MIRDIGFKSPGLMCFHPIPLRKTLLVQVYFLFPGARFVNSIDFRNLGQFFTRVRALGSAKRNIHVLHLSILHTTGLKIPQRVALRTYIQYFFSSSIKKKLSTTAKLLDYNDLGTTTR